MRVKSEIDLSIDGDIEDGVSLDGRPVEDVVASTDGQFEHDGERAGLYLAMLVAFAVPALIVLALFLPNSPVGEALGTNTDATPSSGLDRVELKTIDDVPVEVAGAGQSQDEVSTEIGSPASLMADDDFAAASDDVDSDGVGDAVAAAAGTLSLIHI